MKTRLLWLLILAVGGAALYFGIARPEVSSIPAHLRNPIADLKPPAPPALEPPPLVIPETPQLTLPTLPASATTPRLPGSLEVPIQNQATIDFSTGAPVIKRTGKDQEALDAAMREILQVTEGTRIEAKK